MGRHVHVHHRRTGELSALRTRVCYAPTVTVPARRVVEKVLITVGSLANQGRAACGCIRIFTYTHVQRERARERASERERETRPLSLISSGLVGELRCYKSISNCFSAHKRLFSLHLTIRDATACQDSQASHT